MAVVSDPVSALQAELPGGYRAGDAGVEATLLRSLAGTAAARRNTG